MFQNMFQNFLARLTDRERRMLLYMAISLFVLVLFIGGYIGYSAISTVNDQVAKKKAALARIQKLYDKYKGPDKKIVALKKKIAGNSTFNLTTFIERTGKSLGLIYEKTSENKKEVNAKSKKSVRERRKKGKGLKKEKVIMEYTFTVTYNNAGLEQLTKFLDKVLNSNRLIVIKSINFKTSFNRENIRATITFATYKEVMA